MRLALVVALALAACQKTGRSDPPHDTVALATKPVDAPPAKATVAEAVPAASVPAEAAPMGPRELEELMARAVAMFTAMGAATDAAGGDCEKLAAGLDRVLDDNRGLLAQVKRFKNDKAVEKMGDEWMKAHPDAATAPIAKIAKAAQPCMSNPGFQATMKRFQELGN